MNALCRLNFCISETAIMRNSERVLQQRFGILLSQESKQLADRLLGGHRDGFIPHHMRSRSYASNERQQPMINIAPKFGPAFSAQTVRPHFFSHVWIGM